MSPAILTMSHRELDRSEVMRRLLERRLSQREAATMLGLSVRQTERLFARYRAEGPAALVSRKRGKPSNRLLPTTQRTEALELVRRYYGDFGPTLAHEKLVERHGLCVSPSTLRRWMADDGVLRTRKQRAARAQRPRKRRACLGELVDLQRFGKPVAFYSDKASVFRVNREDHAGTGLTQFGRAMTDLNVDIICANTAAAKGRVERANLTLQDRLVKELRLRGISTIDDGNAFLPEFLLNKHLSAIFTLIREQQLLDTQDTLAAARTHRAREHLSERLNRALSS